MEIMDDIRKGGDPSSASPFPTALRYGIIGGLCFTIYGFVVLTFFSDPADSSLAVSLAQLGISTTLFVGIIVLAVKKYRDEELGGFITFSQAFLSGFVTIMITRTIYILFNLLYTKVIYPDFVKDMQDKMYAAFEKQNMSEEQIESSMKIMKIFSDPVLGTAVALGMAVIIGSIVAAIVAAIMQKNRLTSF